MDELDTPFGESCSCVAESSGGTADERVPINAVIKGFGLATTKRSIARQAEHDHYGVLRHYCDTGIALTFMVSNTGFHWGTWGPAAVQACPHGRRACSKASTCKVRDRA